MDLIVVIQDEPRDISGLTRSNQKRRVDSAYAYQRPPGCTIKLCWAEISYLTLKGFQARLGAVLVLLAGTAAASNGAD